MAKIFKPKVPAAVEAPAPSEPTPEEAAQRAETERVKREQEAQLAADRAALASGLRGRRAFLSSAGESGYALGGL